MTGVTEMRHRFETKWLKYNRVTALQAGRTTLVDSVLAIDLEETKRLINPELIKVLSPTGVARQGDRWLTIPGSLFRFGGVARLAPNSRPKAVDINVK